MKELVNWREILAYADTKVTLNEFKDDIVTSFRRTTFNVVVNENGICDSVLRSKLINFDSSFKQIWPPQV